MASDSTASLQLVPRGAGRKLKIASAPPAIETAMVRT